MTSTNEITGIIKQLSETQAFPSGFTKREIVVTTDEKFPQDIKFDFVKDGCDKLDRYSKGDVVTVSYNVRGNEYNGKHYVSLQGWRIEGNGSKPQARAADQNGAAPPKAAPAPSEDDESDDIPF
jgi:hypothetical protein